MYIIISIFAAYAAGIISYELNIFGYYFTLLVSLLVYNSLLHKKIIYNAVIIAFVILSYLNCNYNSKSVLSQYINENIVVEARIKEGTKTDAEGFYASVISINNTQLFNEEKTIIYSGNSQNIKENTIIRISCNVADSKLTRNRMLYNYDNYLRSKKIKALLFAKSDGVIIKESYSFFNDISNKFTAYTEETFYKSLNKANAAIILSIILGDVDYLDDDLYDNIKQMGLAHIFAVSGTHIVLMYVFLLNAFKPIFSRRLSWILTWSIIWLYGFLIGFPLTVLRALVMFTLLFGSEVLYRKYSSLNSIGLAALILTLYNPYWIFDAGFLLSFSAALSFILYSRFIKFQNTIFKTLYMYLFLQIFTLPVILYYFNFLPIMGILYNLLLLPVFTVIMVYGFILLLFNGLFQTLLLLPFKIFDYILYSLRYIVDIADKIPFKGLILPTMSPYHVIFFYLTMFFMLYLHKNKKSRCKRYGIVALISFYALNYIALPFMDESLYINLADVGQGLFATISYKGLNLVVDCGSNTSDKMGQYIAVPYLTKRGIRKIDGLFISHWDEDHYNGLSDLLGSHIRVKHIFSSSINESFPDIKELRAGDRMVVDDKVCMEIRWPYKNLVLNNINNRSLVISMNYKKSRILFPGDIEEEAENAIYNDLEKHDLVIGPHHGSKTSSSDLFVEALRPEITLLSYGRNNYGIPHEEVILRYENAGSKILSTYEHGEINIILKGDNLYYNTYVKEKSKNYYDLYLPGFIYNMFVFCILLVWLLRSDEIYEL